MGHVRDAIAFGTYKGLTYITSYSVHYHSLYGGSFFKEGRPYE